MNRMLAIAMKELLQVRRDRMTLAMMVMLPVMQLLLFGYAINNDVRHFKSDAFLPQFQEKMVGYGAGGGA